MGDHTDVFAVPMIFLRIGWMRWYQGQTADDQIKGGGAYVAAHGYGHEIFNFRTFDGRVYGYVQPPGSGYNEDGRGGLSLERLGASPDSPSADGVLAIWVATRPEGGTVIVGWCRNATVYRKWQKPPSGSQRQYRGDEFGYYVSAAAEDATLLPADARLFQVPRGAGWMGQANVWYADDVQVHQEVRTEVLKYVATRQPPRPKSDGNGSPRQPDPFLRQAIEKAAVAATIKHYELLGYKVDSVEHDNVGWDLDAIHLPTQVSLKLEVKGLSGSDLCVELTPNEYKKMKLHVDAYRLCVVTSALTQATLAAFQYSVESDRWEDESKRVLNIKEIVAARCSLEH